MVDEPRFTEARKLLENPRARITDVAAAGFDDPAHFARMFRRIGGLSPREFLSARSARLPRTEAPARDAHTAS